MMCSNAFDFSARASRSSVKAGMREWLISTTAAMCIAVGKLCGKLRSTVHHGRLDRYARIIAALAHVDMVIRVDGLLGTKFAAEDLDGTVRDDL